MNKTRTYVFFLLLTALMVTACTLEGDLETVKRMAGIGNNNEDSDPYDPYNPSYPSNTINLAFNSEYHDGAWYYFTEYSNYLSAGAIHTYRFYVSSPGAQYSIEWLDADNAESYGYADIQAAVKREGASSYIVGMTDDGGFPFYPSTSGYYILEIRGFNSYTSGNYGIFVAYY